MKGKDGLYETCNNARNQNGYTEKAERPEGATEKAYTTDETASSTAEAATFERMIRLGDRTGINEIGSGDRVILRKPADRFPGALNLALDSDKFDL